MIYNSILETIGNTPVVRLNRMGPDHVEMYVKVESFNPLASVKDRLAFAIIYDAEKRGHDPVAMAKSILFAAIMSAICSDVPW